MRNGIKENGAFKIFIALLFCVVILGLIFVFKTTEKDISFEVSDEKYFMSFSKLYDKDRYKIKEFDIYYLEDTDYYFYEMKYDLFLDVDDIGWCDIDEVHMGKEGYFNKMFCLNWKQNDLIDYQDEIKELERAKKEGIHKSYTIDEIMKKIEEAKKNDN